MYGNIFYCLGYTCPLFRLSMVAEKFTVSFYQRFVCTQKMIIFADFPIPFPNY